MCTLLFWPGLHYNILVRKCFFPRERGRLSQEEASSELHEFIDQIRECRTVEALRSLRDKLERRGYQELLKSAHCILAADPFPDLANDPATVWEIGTDPLATYPHTALRFWIFAAGQRGVTRQEAVGILTEPHCNARLDVPLKRKRDGVTKASELAVRRLKTLERSRHDWTFAVPPPPWDLVWPFPIVAEE